MNQPGKAFYSKLARGHPAAFEDVLRWYAEDVLRLASLLLNDSDEARDILQETMLKFVEEVKHKRIHMNNGSIKPLLMTIARNLCINRLRKHKRLVEFPDGCVDQLAQSADIKTPYHSANDLEFETAFHQALQQLSPIQRTVMVLHELQHESFHEIAESLDMHYEAVKKNFYRGIKKMRVLLAPFSR